MTAFLRPVRREFILFGVIIVPALGLGRFWAGDGGAWVWLALIITAATNLPALRALDVRSRRWLGQALATAGLWSVVLAAIETAAANLMQHRSPYYAYYDRFLVTHGPVEHLDTNGEPYVLQDLGITAGTAAWPFVLSLLMFLIFAILGLAIGLALKRWPQLMALALAGVVGVLVLAAVTHNFSWSAEPWLNQPVSPDLAHFHVM